MRPKAAASELRRRPGFLEELMAGMRHDDLEIPRYEQDSDDDEKHTANGRHGFEQSVHLFEMPKEPVDNQPG